ncbi:hypothetical protein MTR67_014447 [Solanum verrucosum]|uniref:F-box protein n=1 Tax=Solanum verrucosum TaxID=315347 RepID=A0AAF0QDW7_SOLVR|nr:hypothetical protein MTR67_014447 [Solanum verrucosum]
MTPSRCCCVFNPITGAHQLIPFPKSPEFELETTGLTVDYPNSDQYKLVTISKVVENSSLFYKFHLLSSEQSGLWREIQLRTNTFISFSDNPSVYWRDSLYWLRSDGSVLAFDTKKEEAILIDRPEFIDHYVLSYGKILTSKDMSGSDIWLGRAQGLLTHVCIFRMYIVIGTCDSASSRWMVSQILDNFISGLDGIVIGFPVWIDTKQVSFLVQSNSPGYHDLYEYDAKINGYKNAAVLDKADYPEYIFHPTLACVHKSPSRNVTAAYQVYIAANLYDIKRFIIKGMSIQEDEEESSSSEEEDEEVAGGGEEIL